jgi:hypothetical protein
MSRRYGVSGGFNLVCGHERVGNEAVVSTWNLAGDGLVTKQLAFDVTRSEFVGQKKNGKRMAGRGMEPCTKVNHFIAHPFPRQMIDQWKKRVSRKAAKAQRKRRMN